MSWKILYGYTSYVDNYCANDQIFSLGPKESIETNNSKNSCFHDDKSFWPFFPRIIEWDKRQGVSDFKRVQRYFDKYFANDKILSLGPVMSIETHLFKKSCFQDHKSFWPIFPPYIAFERPQGTTFEGPQAILTNTLENKKAFFGNQRLLKTQSCEKQGNLSTGEKILASFFSFHRTWKLTRNKL